MENTPEQTITTLGPAPAVLDLDFFNDLPSIDNSFGEIINNEEEEVVNNLAIALRESTPLPEEEQVQQDEELLNEQEMQEEEELLDSKEKKKRSRVKSQSNCYQLGKELRSKLAKLLGMRPNAKTSQNAVMQQAIIRIMELEKENEELKRKVGSK